MMTTFDCSGSREPQRLHCHDEIEVVAVYIGRGALQVGRSKYRTFPEMLAIVAPQEIHAGTPSTNDFAVRGFNLSTRLIANLDPDWEHALAHDGVRTEPLALAAFQAAFSASPERNSKMECDEWLLRLFQAILKPLQQKQAKEKSRIALAVEWLRANLAEDTSLPAIASLVGVTPEYFCRAFRQHTGLPPHAYRSRLRVARAVTLLRQGATASEAALAVGFYDQSHLTRYMRKQIGLTPGHFRSQSRPISRTGRAATLTRMQTEHLQTRQISQEALDWYLQYLAAIDKKDIDAYGTFLAEDCVMVQNNQDPVAGKPSILAGLRQYWTSFQSMEHDLFNIYGTDHAFALEANNIYTRLDGRKVTVRAVALTTRNTAGLVTSFRFYTDVSPVFQPS